MEFIFLNGFHNSGGEKALIVARQLKKRHRLKKLRILILSSKEKTNEQLEKALQQTSFSVEIYNATWFSDLEEILRNYHPDLVVVSWTPEEKTLHPAILKLIQQNPYLPVLLSAESFLARKVSDLLHHGISEIVTPFYLPQIGNFINTALEEKKEREAAENYARNQDTMLQGIIELLSRAVEMHDPSIGQHQRLVAGIARSIARKMEFPEEGVYWAGMVHDIGKLAVPEEILSKTALLSDVEKKVVETHSREGYNLLEGISFPWPIQEIVLQHHERMDGSGYPLGLPGDQILMEARILGVADVVQAMASTRPHRPSLGLKGALEEISRNKGKLFDSRVVEACLEVFEGHY